MAKICPQCGREFENSRVRCPICKIDLVSDGIDNSEAARQERLERLRQQQFERVQQSRPNADYVAREVVVGNIKCPKCGNLITGVSEGQTVKCQKCGGIFKLSARANDSTISSPYTKSKGNGYPLATWKLVSGILSIVLFMFVAFQSCAAGLGNAITNNGEVSGSAGLVVSIMLLAGGIVSVATRKSGKGGDIALIVLYGIGALVGFALAGSYSDLRIWALWCLVCVILAIISLTKKRN